MFVEAIVYNLHLEVGGQEPCGVNGIHLPLVGEGEELTLGALGVGIVAEHIVAAMLHPMTSDLGSGERCLRAITVTQQSVCSCFVTKW